MSTFGADVGAIWRMSLDTVSKAILTSIRYHGDAEGRCEVSVRKVADMAGVGRATAFRRIAIMVDAGILVREGGTGERSTYRVNFNPSHRETGNPSQAETPPRLTVRPPPSQAETPPVSQGDGSPTPPNREIQTFSRPLPEAAVAPAPPQERAREAEPVDFAPVEAAWQSARRAVSVYGRGAGVCLSDLETRGLLKLVGEHGTPRVVAAIEEAAVSNTRDCLSVNFVRSVLERMTQRPRARAEPATPVRDEPRDRMLTWDEVIARAGLSEVGT